ncbi:MAG TPA: hypothetical protein VGQ81_14735 [Acidobacteriota bacterium]|nr:hypothetical protein [Acidobacteriota bacterium]
MSLRDDILKRIERKQAELEEEERAFERAQAAGEAYIQALQDTLKTLPRDIAEAKPEKILRAGGIMAKARQAILSNGNPMPINDILMVLGKTPDRKARASVSGAIGNYVRKGEVFVRTGPNTFGLIELGHRSDGITEEPPPGFGSLEPDEDDSGDNGPSHQWGVRPRSSAG